MYMVIRKLQLVKQGLKQLNVCSYSDLRERCDAARKTLSHIQGSLGADPFNTSLLEQERKTCTDYDDLSSLLLSQLQQKARMKWVQDANANTRCFYAAISQRRM